MSHSSFFQKDLSVFNFSPHNMMFYDVIRRQCDRSFVLCKGKNSYKNTRYVFYVPFLSQRSLQLLLSRKTQKMRSKCSKGMIFQRWSYYGNRIRTCKKCETLTASFELQEHSHITSQYVVGDGHFLRGRVPANCPLSHYGPFAGKLTP